MEKSNNKLKHINIKFHFKHDNIKNNKITLNYINTKKNDGGSINQGLKWIKDDQIYRPNI